MTQEQEFLDAFDEYADALFRHCILRISDRERAKDIVSDAFAKTWDYLVKGGVIVDFKPFLYRCMNNLIVDEYRKKKNESLDALLNEQEVPESAFPELVVGDRDDFELEVDAKHVGKLLEQMPDKYREVVVMRYLDGLLPAEIAELLGESVNSVSVRIHRGMAWLTKRAQELHL